MTLLMPANRTTVFFFAAVEPHVCVWVAFRLFPFGGQIWDLQAADLATLTLAITLTLGFCVFLFRWIWLSTRQVYHKSTFFFVNS